MNLQQINPKILSITQLRRDIDVLKKILEREKEAIVVKNQKVLFMVVDPEKYKKLIEKKDDNAITNSLSIIKKLREKKSLKRNSLSSYVIKMREERIKKWKKL